MSILRTIIADDERPARNFLKNILLGFGDVELIGEAESGAEAFELIKREKPDLALLDLQMPELSGLEVVKLLRKNQMPLVAFITAFDEYAIRAFEVNAVDYLLKPVEKERLRETLDRVQERLEHKDFRETETRKMKNAFDVYESNRTGFIERIPVKNREEILLIPVGTIASVVAEGELLHISTGKNDRYIINYRLKDLEAKLDPAVFIRLSRGALANISMFEKIEPQAGGTFQITLQNGQQIPTSRLQSRVLRERLLKL